MLVEDLFGSKVRTRILRILVEEEKLNISHIARKSGMNHSDTNIHLEKFNEMGLIKEKHLNNMRIFEPTFKTVVVRFEKGSGIQVDVNII